MGGYIIHTAFPIDLATHIYIDLLDWNDRLALALTNKAALAHFTSFQVEDSYIFTDQKLEHISDLDKSNRSLVLKRVSKCGTGIKSF